MIHKYQKDFLPSLGPNQEEECEDSMLHVGNGSKEQLSSGTLTVKFSLLCQFQASFSLNITSQLIINFSESGL